ncbi:ABC transporter permease subunit [candidate division KSB3 bacterium]|uniref:ABC transporter permease subunit n=1 Tax=candidate division KSB3 bacterium TaxID=2044937 RepID=A0A9D5JZU3_9BACT|nr:ABC transporter permease subunit [candidate division KSB3 bacterium]MBD3327263.1 ABC transporter permease subunit [candidate division KSB3 bacterium]
MFRERWVRILAYSVSTLFAILVIVPFLWVLMTSLKTPADISVWPPRFLPSKITLENFKKILVEEDFLRYILNSLIVSLGSMGCILLTSSLAGFIFAKYKFPFKRFLFVLILGTAIIPLQVYMIPIFIMVFKAKMMNTYLAMIFPMTIMTFGVFFMRQNIMAIPDELLDSARIDGASEFWIYLRVVLSLSKSALMALGIFAFSQAWANFIWPLVVVTTKEMYTTELGLAVYQRQFYIEYGAISAGAVITIIPMVVVFFFLRRNILQGVTTSGMKT